MKYWGKDETHIKIECDKCNKIYKFDKNYFSQITEISCTPISEIKCPCGNSTSDIIYSDQPILTDKSSPEAKCPRCGSKNITVQKRGWTWTTGFIGMNKNKRICSNCLFKW